MVFDGDLPSGKRLHSYGKSENHHLYPLVN